VSLFSADKEVDCGILTRSARCYIGKLATVQQYVHQFEKEEESFQFSEHDDVSAVAGVLKVSSHRGDLAICLTDIVFCSFICDNYRFLSSLS